MRTVREVLSELDSEPSLSAYSAAARKLKQCEDPLADFRIAILANHTFEIETVLGVECARRGFRAAFYQAGYDQYRQELLNPQGGLDQFQPDAVILSLNLESAFPGVTTSSAASAHLPARGEWVAGLMTLLNAFRSRSSVPVFIQDFVPPAHEMDGLLECSGTSLFEWTAELNGNLRRSACEVPSVYVIQASRLAASHDLPAWRDPRMWYLARTGINPKKFPILASRIARALAALKRPPAKCVVLDLDHTVWGGVLGDAGVNGIHCAGPDYPANAFADFQRCVLALRARGILLAVASKNDRAVVDEAFRIRTDMPLRPEHISDWEVNWGPKPESLQRIAARLNIGLDSMVFLDDNPVEIDLMRRTLPQVRTYQVPPRAEQRVDFMLGLEDFDQLHASAEDLRRAELYDLRKRQAEIAASATDLESFYRSLGTVLAAEPAGPANFDRIVQLIGKTNQFNLTTRRHDKAALNARIAKGSELWAFRASDVHGDHGIIAVALLDFEGGVCTIDTLLMSCRVIGRTLETAILHHLENCALARGATEFHGEYLPTAKNALCRDLYAQHGFTATPRADGGIDFTKDPRAARIACPEWISIRRGLNEECVKI